MEQRTHLLKLTSTQIIIGLHAQSFHWNVVGQHFFELHNMFGDVYKILVEHTDELAERMRALELLAPVSPKEIFENSKVSLSHNETSSAVNMVKSLRDDLGILVDACREVISAFPEDLETADMLTGFMITYGKQMWIMNSFLDVRH